MDDATLHLIDLALAEDRAREDVTSALLPAGRRARGAIVGRQELVLCGVEIAAAVFARLDPAVRVEAIARDGDRLAPGAEAARVDGPAASILAGERTALNFLGRLSGVATLAARYAAAVAGTPAVVSDTRKTTPGWRRLEKYAVRTGGAANHRADLAEAVLLKDNHVAAFGSVGAAVRAARERAPAGIAVEVEVTTLAELGEALDAGATAVLLDNMDDATVAEAAARARGRAFVEVSGGVTLERVASLARLGVDRISVGRLTHSAPCADLSLELERS